jgi:Cys-rich protein (TIGR01571 family)
MGQSKKKKKNNFFSWILNLFCSTACNSCASVSYRNQVRTKYGIRGSLTNDCFAGCCCQCCSTSQILREGKKKKLKKIVSWRGPAIDAML